MNEAQTLLGGAHGLKIGSSSSGAKAGQGWWDRVGRGVGAPDFSYTSAARLHLFKLHLHKTYQVHFLLKL